MIQKTQAYIEDNVAGANVVYGDTDSVFFFVRGFGLGEFDCEGLADKITTTLFRPPIRLEFEKSYFPLILQAKKRYLGTKFEAGKLDQPGKRDSRGDVLQRRDVPASVRDLYDQMCDLILEKRQLGVDESIALLRRELNDIVKGLMDPVRLSLTRQMTKDFASYAKTNSHLPHVEVAKKKIDRGETVNSNDRIQIVIIADRPGFKPEPAWKRAEDLQYAIEKKLHYDIMYYIGGFSTGSGGRAWLTRGWQDATKPPS